MTDLVEIALVTATPPTIMAILNFIVSLINHSRMNTVITSVNGVQDKLIEETKASSYAAGIKHEQDSPEIK